MGNSDKVFARRVEYYERVVRKSIDKDELDALLTALLSTPLPFQDVYDAGSIVIPEDDCDGEQTQGISLSVHPNAAGDIWVEYSLGKAERRPKSRRFRGWFGGGNNTAFTQALWIAFWAALRSKR